MSRNGHLECFIIYNLNCKLREGEEFMENKALIVGNGFSINFDYSFANIYNNLNKGKNLVLNLGEFDISLGAKPNTRKALKRNYQSVLKFVRHMEQSKLELIFKDAIKFASFIIGTPRILNELLESKYIHRLKIAPSMIEITEKIAQIGKEKGVNYVNIENWPVLFWLYNLVDRTPEFRDFKKSPNLFITLMALGETEKLCDSNVPGSVMIRTRTNGFAIFYRLLMISIIFNDGKAIDAKKLSNNMDKETLNTWLTEFKSVLSLNYDKILEGYLSKEVVHLHGDFSNFKKGDIFYYSYAILYDGKKYYTNNILLGDYTTTKVLDGFIYQLVMNKQAFAQPMKDPLKLLENTLGENHINHIVFFGVNPENDYHILSGIYYYFYKNKIENPKITYCFYKTEEIREFKSSWEKIINDIYSKTQEYYSKVEVEYMDSKEIINKKFKKVERLNDIRFHGFR